MVALERCLHQVFRSKNKIRLPPEIRGGSYNCNFCEYDSKNNQRCLLYTPITIWTLDVGEVEKNKLS